MGIETIFSLSKSAVMIVLVMVLAQIFLIYDRRVLRISRFRSLFQGNLTIFSEVIKLIFKERISRGYFFRFAPLVIFILAFIPVIVVPICGEIVLPSGMVIVPEVFSVEYGTVIAVLAMSLYSYFCAFIGFLSRNSKSSLNSFRMISHVFTDDMLLVISLLGIIFVNKSFGIHEIILAQELPLLGAIPSWGVFTQPVGAVIFLFVVIMKSDRPPFNYSSTGNEIGPGFESLFSSISFMMVLFSKYIFTVVGAMVFTTFFLGGYSLIPGMHLLEIGFPFGTTLLQAASFIIKTIVVIILLSCMRSARLQYERSVYFSWVILMPVGLISILITVIYSYQIGKI